MRTIKRSCDPMPTLASISERPSHRSMGQTINDSTSTVWIKEDATWFIRQCRCIARRKIDTFDQDDAIDQVCNTGNPLIRSRRYKPCRTAEKECTRGRACSSREPTTRIKPNTTHAPFTVNIPEAALPNSHPQG